MSAILYINDNNLLLQQGSEVSHSQAYAWFQDGSVYFDSDPQKIAVNHCRLTPQQINSRYWQQCDQSAIGTNESAMRHSADIVWSHLKELKSSHQLGEIAFAVPAHYQSDNLKLLLGVSKACGLKVTALISKPVLILQDQLRQEGEYQHIDVQLHQTVCSTISVAGGKLKLAGVDVLQDVSIHTMQDALLRAMQNNFIQSDRFDPMHDASTEQQLFDQIAKISGEVARQGKANLLVEHRGRLHTSNIDAKQWAAALEPFMIKLEAAGENVAAGNSFVQLNNVFNGALPASLNGRSFAILSDNDVVQATQILALPGGDGELRYITELPTLGSSEPTATQQVEETPPQKPKTQIAGVRAEMGTTTPTHLLQGGIAVAIEHAGINTQNNDLVLSSQQQSNLATLLDENKIFVMSEPERKDLRANDRLGSNIADGVITAITVLD